MEIVVRCDASPGTGLGHASRALAVADAVSCRFGGRIVFVSHAEPLLEGFLRDRGLALEPLQGEGYEPEAVLGRAGSGGIVISDTYDLDGAALDAIADAGHTHVVIDDFARLGSWRCDVVVNPNLGSEEQAYDGAAAVLVGPDYALIRREVRDAAAESPQREGNRLLVCLGGGAWPDAAMTLLADLASLAQEGIEVRATTEQPLPAGTVPVPPRELPSELVRCDVGLLSGGVVKYEAAVCGLPAVLTAVVPHQVPLVPAFAETGAAVGGPPLSEDAAPVLVGAVRQLFADPARRAEVGRRAQTLVDGRGAERVAAAITRAPGS